MSGQTPVRGESGLNQAAEGVIKFSIERWERTPALDESLFFELERVRAKLVDRGLVGVDAATGIGYGNLSRRLDEGRFVITGSQTGGLASLDGRHYVIITGADFARGTVSCYGPVAPSSESLSHAAFYADARVGPDVNVGADMRVGAVLHVHWRARWEALLEAARDGRGYLEGRPFRVVGPEAAYGSRELYERIRALMAEPELDLPVLLALAGHESGLFAAGGDAEEAYRWLS